MTLAGLVSGMKLNANKTKTMIVSRSRTMHPQSPPFTIGETVVKESDDLVILGVTFDSKMNFEKHLRSVSRAASQRLGFLRKSWQLLYDRSHIGTHMHRLAAGHCSTAELLFPSRCPSGTILLTPNSMVWDWRVLRTGPMLLYWPKLLHPYYNILLTFPFSSFCL